MPQPYEGTETYTVGWPQEQSSDHKTRTQEPTDGTISFKPSTVVSLSPNGSLCLAPDTIRFGLSRTHIILSSTHTSPHLPLRGPHRPSSPRRRYLFPKWRPWLVTLVPPVRETGGPLRRQQPSFCPSWVHPVRLSRHTFRFPPGTRIKSSVNSCKSRWTCNTYTWRKVHTQDLTTLDSEFLVLVCAILVSSQ